jgi:hypothetical protein
MKYLRTITKTNILFLISKNNRTADYANGCGRKNAIRIIKILAKLINLQNVLAELLKVTAEFRGTQFEHQFTSHH